MIYIAVGPIPTALVIECARVFPLAHCGTNRLSAVASGSWLCATCCSESCTPFCFIEGVSAVGKLQWFPQTRSALPAECLLPHLGFYGRLMGIGRLMRIELQHGSTIDRISLVSQSRASEHRRHTSARHTQIYNMVESVEKHPERSLNFLGVLDFLGVACSRISHGKKEETTTLLGAW